MILFFLVCMFVLPAFSQEYDAFPVNYYSTQHLDIYSGLSSDSITEVFQDSQGYIWIGSYDGIMRFDGSDIEVFDSYTTKNLKAHSARCFREKDSELWIASGQGLILYNDSQFTTYTKDDGLLSNSVSALAFDSRNRLWIGCNQGLQFISPAAL